MIVREDRGSVAVVRMEHGKVNAIDLELFTALKEQLEQLEQSESTAVVLTGTGKAFSAGVDLFRLLEEGKGYISRFLPVLVEGLKTLFLFSKPVVAAINGHAIAGGCLIACSADYKVAAAGPATIGVPELLVGVPFPPLALEILRFAVSPEYLQQIVYGGIYYSMEQGKQLGIVDEIAPSEDLLNRACEKAMQLSRIPFRAFQFTKLQMREPSVERARKFGKSDEEILSLWFATETHQVIRNYLKNTVGKK